MATKIDAKSSKNAEQFDAVDMDPGFRKFMPTQLETEDMTLDRTMFLPDDQTDRFGIPAGAEPAARVGGEPRRRAR